MIKVIRSVQVQSGKGREAAQWAQEVTDWLNARQPGSNIQVFREVFGNAGTLYWLGDAEDIATIERQVAERESNPEWRALVERAADLVLPGSLHDTLLRST
jgi:hypothetical protein